MTHTLIFLVDLLTNSQTVAAVAHDALLFGLANTGLACLLGSMEIRRRSRPRRKYLAFSRA